jgi:hypothetical protein
VTEKTAKPASRRLRIAKPKKQSSQSSQPSHDEISERAYFIHLTEGGPDELQNWLRAERELTAA